MKSEEKRRKREENAYVPKDLGHAYLRFLIYDLRIKDEQLTPDIG